MKKTNKTTGAGGAVGRHAVINGIKCFEAVIDGEEVWLPCDHYEDDEGLRYWRDSLGDEIANKIFKDIMLGEGVLTTVL